MTDTSKFLFQALETIDRRVKQNVSKARHANARKSTIHKLVTRLRKGESLFMCTYIKVEDVCMVLKVAVSTSALKPIWQTLKHTFLMLCAVWYHLYNLKNVRNTHGWVLLSVTLKALICKFTNTFPWVFFVLFKLYKNDTKLWKASHLIFVTTRFLTTPGKAGLHEIPG